ncbi:MAG TPA: cytochrome-c oxidase, cbb3-type subunit III [Gammaproteobacteria bacterium]
MANLPSDFWGGWVALITIVSLLGLAWLVYSVYFVNRSDASVAHQVWDETLREGTAAAPLWWFWLIVALLAFTVVYLMLYPGLGSYRGTLQWSQGGRLAESAARYDAEFGAARARIAATDAEALRGDAAVLRSAASVFRNNCAACHGEDAGGQAKTFPNLTDREWQWGGDTAQLEQTITAGRQAVMPPWQAVLGDTGISAVADYVISLSRVEPGRIGLAEGKRLFDLYCTACHGADGAGNTALGAPPLNDGSWLYGGSTLDVRKTIALGRNGVMPSFATRLEPAQIKMLVALLGQPRVETSE